MIPESAYDRLPERYRPPAAGHLPSSPRGRPYGDRAAAGQVVSPDRPPQPVPRTPSPSRAGSEAVRPASRVASHLAATVAGISRLAGSWVGLGLIAVLAVVPRVAELGHLSLSTDEGYTLAFIRQPWAEVLGLNGFYDLHPPLFYPVVKLAGVVVSDAIAARLVAAVTGVLSVVVFFHLCDRLMDRRVALAASALLVVSPLHLYLSRWGRMYSPMVLAVLVSYLALVAYSSEPTRRWAITYGASIAAAMYIDYSAAYALVPQALLLALVVRRLRRDSRGLVAATGAAVVLFLPWVPELIRTVRSVSGTSVVQRSTLELTWPKVGEAVTMILGLDSVGFRERAGHLNAWERWPDYRLLLVLGLVPAISLGCLALSRSRVAALVAGLLAVGTLAVIIGTSVVSPGLAPRTVLACVPGFALVASASFARSLDGVVPRWLRSLGVASWGFAVAVAVLSWPPVYLGGTHDQWPQVTDALADQAHLGWPIVTISSAGLATDLITAYADDRLDGVPLLTVVYGHHAIASGNELALERGPTLEDLKAGALEARLPRGDPRYDAFWLVLTGDSDAIESQTDALGYSQITETKHYKAVVRLYARPTAILGEPVDVNGDFAGEGDSAHGWELPRRSTSLRPTAGRGRELVLAGTDDRVRAHRVVPAGMGLYTLDVAVGTSGAEGVVALTCLAASGDGLTSHKRAMSEARGPRLQAAVVCPEATRELRIVLEQTGSADLRLSDVRLYESLAP